MNLNKVLLIGRLTADPQLKSTQGGQSVASFSIATNRVWLDRQNQKQTEVQYHNIVVWGRQAEIASQFLKKGALAYVEGRLQTRSWQDQQGQNRKTTEIVAERVQFGPRAAGAPVGDFSDNQGGTGRGFGSSELSEAKEEVLPEINLDDIPDLDSDGDKKELKAEDIPF